MSLIELILLAVALGIDCLVVSFSQGLIFNTNRLRNALALAFTMGIFQGIMPLIGSGCAFAVSRYVDAFADWIAFAIFLALGLKFIYEAFQKEKDEPKICCIGLKCLIGMGIATSIDALGAGVSLHFSDVNILPAVVLIGLASFLLSGFGFWLGNCLKHLPSKYLEIFGGLILIWLAVKSLI